MYFFLRQSIKAWILVSPSAILLDLSKEKNQMVWFCKFAKCRGLLVSYSLHVTKARLFTYFLPIVTIHITALPITVRAIPFKRVQGDDRKVYFVCKEGGSSP